MIRTRGNRVALVVGLAAAVDFAGIWACQNDLERPPHAGCSGASCPTLPPISGGGSGPGPDAAPPDAFADVPADAVVELTGVVRAFSDDGFQNTVAFQEAVEIRSEGPAGNELVATYDGQNPFALPGVPFSRNVWVTAIPTVPPEEAMVTLTPVDTTQPDSVVISLVRGSTLDTIYNVLTNPVVRSSDKGQVVLRFVTEAATPSPLAGVRATLAGAEARIYDTGGGFSDIEVETGPLGLALFANVNALALPGAELNVRLEGLVSTTVKVRIAANTATFAQIQLPTGP
jgi:hypothetical protein